MKKWLSEYKNDVIDVIIMILFLFAVELIVRSIGLISFVNNSFAELKACDISEDMLCSMSMGNIVIDRICYLLLWVILCLMLMGVCVVARITCGDKRGQKTSLPQQNTTVGGVIE